MKDLSDMKISEFIDAILAHPNEYSQLEVYDYLDEKTNGFSVARVDALWELLSQRCPAPAEYCLTEGRNGFDDARHRQHMTVAQWKSLETDPDFALCDIVVNEIEDWVTIRPKQERLFWYAHDILQDAYNDNMNAPHSHIPQHIDIPQVHDYPQYLMTAFGNNSLLIDKFFERIASIPGKQKTTPIAIDIDALKSLGVLNVGKLTTFTDELNKALTSRGMVKIKYKSLSDKIGEQKKKHENEFVVAVSIYKCLLED